ncbi:hypothetical protein Asera_11860 [Actinocatenispora sera]|uniref:Uncharacterized protein n=1 Tax=Actinocatenispora sera TaxID=390989 RepID=A0A810KYH6_9ACTN|nr:hypothetical protein Asera_11860 [Actinocatenispora sera]
MGRRLVATVGRRPVATARAVGRDPVGRQADRPTRRTSETRVTAAANVGPELFAPGGGDLRCGTGSPPGGGAVSLVEGRGDGAREASIEP